jgi:HEAT repeat protein
MYQRPPRSTLGCRYSLSSKPPPELDSRRTTRRTLRPDAPRTRLASKIERVLATALGSDPRVVLNVKASEVLAEPRPVAEVISAALESAGNGLMSQLAITHTFRRSGLEPELLNSLASPDPALRIAGARLCGALRLPDAVPWLADLLDDASPAVRDVAVRSLANAGGHRVVAALMARADHLPSYRLAQALARAASDIDLESLLREPIPVKTKVTVLMACGLRGDALYGPLLVRMAQDRQCETEIRVAACRALAMIGEPAGADAMRTLATEQDETVRRASVRARMRISAAMRKRIG